MGDTFEAEREALRSALRFPDPPSRPEGLAPGRRPTQRQPAGSRGDVRRGVHELASPRDVRPLRRERDGNPPTGTERDLLEAIAAQVDHLASSLDALIEQVNRLTERLDVFGKAALTSSEKRLDAHPASQRR
ncbi:MAG: hypothetical protein ACRDTT_25745 [Pseudonocardiaceae bacterium]